MDADQLISGIGSAVASAQSQNHCFVWCMTKSEWASWVQAFGSIAAIIATWYITSRQKRFELERDSRLAALDSATMHAELWMAINTLEKAKDKAQELLDNREAYTGITRFHFSQQLNSVHVRQLDAQNKLVTVGENYLNEIYGVLDDFEMIKIGAEQIIGIFSYDEPTAFDQLESLVVEIMDLQRKMKPVCGMLADFSLKYGIVLKNPKIDIEAFEGKGPVETLTQ